MMEMAKVEGEEIVIRIRIDVIQTAVGAVPGWPENYRVADPAEAAKAIVYRLNDEEEDGTTLIHRALDQAVLTALEQGDEGFEEVAPEQQEEE